MGLSSDYQIKKIENRQEPKFDREKIMQAVKMIIEALGDNPEREGLKGTPDRVARMYEEVYEGMAFTNDEIVEMFNTCFETDNNDLVVVEHIPIFSHCEHHLALMYNMNVSVAYIPNKKVIGLSKVARVADMVSKRLQLQERIGEDICYILNQILDTDNIMVVIEGEHSCMTTRGIKSNGAKTKTASLRGLFRNDSDLRNEVYNLLSRRI